MEDPLGRGGSGSLTWAWLNDLADGSPHVYTDWTNGGPLEGPWSDLEALARVLESRGAAG